MSGAPNAGTPVKPAARRLLERARAVQASEAAVPSPCTSVCRMDPVTERCQGCWRTLDEIAAWGRLPEDGRRAIWARIESRLRGPEAS